MFITPHLAWEPFLRVFRKKTPTLILGHDPDYPAAMNRHFLNELHKLPAGEGYIDQFEQNKTVAERLESIEFTNVPFIGEGDSGRPDFHALIR